MKLNKILFLVSVLFGTTLGLYGQVPKKPNPQRLVNDYIGILSKEDLSELETKLVEFDNQTSIQVAVVLVSTTDGMDIAEYAQQIGEKWGVGQKELDNGAVFVVAKDDRRMFIATGYGLENDEDLPDARCHKITEEVVKPHFKKNDYPAGVKAGVEAILHYLGHMSWSDREARNEHTKEQKRRLEEAREKERDRVLREAFESFLLIVIALLIMGLAYFIIRRMLKNGEIVRARRSFIADLKKRLAQIREDETSLSTNWPQWAKEEYQKLKAEYDKMEEQCERIINALPKGRRQLLRLDSNTLEQIEDQLNTFDEIDRALAKILEDVEFYDKNVEGSLNEITSLFVTTQKKCEIAGSKGHGTNTWMRKLGEIKADLAKMVVTDPDSKRRLYHEAYDKKQMLDSIMDSINSEQDAKKEVEELLPKFISRIADVDKGIKPYESNLDFLSSQYSGLSVASLMLASVMVQRSENAKRSVSEAEKILASTADRKFRSALKILKLADDEIQTIRHNSEKVGLRIRELENKKSEFPKKYATTEKLVKEALEAIKDTDVTSETQELARNSMKELKRAKDASSALKVDWLTTWKHVELASKQAQDAIDKAKSDVEKARRRRRKAREARASVSHSSSYSSSSSSSYSGSSGSGGFGGFGGGSFGGGGGGSSW